MKFADIVKVSPGDSKVGLTLTVPNLDASAQNRAAAGVAAAKTAARVASAVEKESCILAKAGNDTRSSSNSPFYASSRRQYWC